MESMPKVAGSEPPHAASGADDVRMHASSGGATTTEMSREAPIGSIRADMRKALAVIKCLAKHTYVDREIAGIHINGVGRIDLPLQDRQAGQIIAQARKAPIDGADVVDFAISDTWELFPDQFKMVDKGWSNVVTTLCQEIAVDMGYLRLLEREK